MDTAYPEISEASLYSFGSLRPVMLESTFFAAASTMLDEDFPDYARKYYEPRLMNLYRGIYRGGK